MKSSKKIDRNYLDEVDNRANFDCVNDKKAIKSI